MLDYNKHAGERTRTSTGFKAPPGPKPGASTDSATPAYLYVSITTLFYLLFLVVRILGNIQNIQWLILRVLQGLARMRFWLLPLVNVLLVTGKGP